MTNNSEANLDGTSNVLSNENIFSSFKNSGLKDSGVSSFEYFEFVKKMKGVETTNGWDLIYSIRENKLNDKQPQSIYEPRN